MLECAVYNKSLLNNLYLTIHHQKYFIFLFLFLKTGNSFFKNIFLQLKIENRLNVQTSFKLVSLKD